MQYIVEKEEIWVENILSVAIKEQNGKINSTTIIQPYSGCSTAIKQWNQAKNNIQITGWPISERYRHRTWRMLKFYKMDIS